MKKKIVNNLFIGVAIGVIGVTSFSIAKTKIVSANSRANTSRLSVENNSFGNTSLAQEKIEGAIVDGVQVIETDLTVFGYPSIVVQKDKPVKLIINATNDTLNSCNNKIIMNDFGIIAPLNIGENIIEFTPTETGEFVYTCWMGMIGATITVVDEDIVPSSSYGENISTGGCCSFSY